MKRIFLFIISMFGLMLIVLISISTYMHYQARGLIYSSLAEVPYHRVGLVFGTTPRLPDGRQNLFFLHRIQAAKDLYEAGKIDKILVSGDNEHLSYNEPEYMKQALVQSGISEEDIVLDYAGFRTRDSVIRALSVFEQSNVTLISQRFQLERALLVAQAIGLDAHGYEAPGVSVGSAPRVYIREIFARAIAIWDVFLDTPPRFLGETIPIP